MPSLAAPGSISSLLASLHAWAKTFFTLAMVEGKQAGLRLLSVLGLALLAIALAITGWLWLLAGIVLALVQNNIASWGSALGLVALLSFAGAGGLVLVMQRRPMPLFAATRRQFGPARKLDAEVSDNRPHPLVPYEQDVEEGRIAAHAEYQEVRKNLHRRLGSPRVIVGGLLAGVAVGYLAGRRRSRRQPDPGHPSVWLQAIGAVQTLTPLWLALRLATRPQAPDVPSAVPPPKSEGAAAAEKQHGF